MARAPTSRSCSATRTRSRTLPSTCSRRWIPSPTRTTSANLPLNTRRERTLLLLLLLRLLQSTRVAPTCHRGMTLDLVLASNLLHLYDPRVHSASPRVAPTDLRASASANGAWTPVGTRHSAASAA